MSALRTISVKLLLSETIPHLFDTRYPVNIHKEYYYGVRGVIWPSLVVPMRACTTTEELFTIHVPGL